jgi:hypothetical protein
MRKLCLLIVGMAVVLMLLPSFGAACPKCFSAAGQKVLNAYYVSIAFLGLIPFGIIGAILVWIHRQTRGRDPIYEKSN